MKSHTRPPRLLPDVQILPRECDRRFEHGYRFLSEKFAAMEVELERLRTMIFDKQQKDLDNGIGKG